MHGHRRSIPFALLLLVACDSADKSSASQSIAKALEAPPPKKPTTVTAGEGPKTPKPVDPTALPWSIDDVRSALAAGTKLVYVRSGVDAKGKKVGGKLTYLLRATNDEGATTSYTVDPDPGTNLASSQAAHVPWSNSGPFFAMERPTSKVSGRESVTVPAGTFEASVAEVDDFFGNHKKLWMIVDKPGVYAKVVDGGANDPADKTEITLELEAIVAPAN